MPNPIGSFHGVPVHEDPNLPDGIIYFLHEHWLNKPCNPSLACWKNNSRRERILLLLKRWYNFDMKKHYIVLGVLVVIGVGLAALAVHKYQTTPKGLTINQAVDQRNRALVDLKIQKLINQNDQQAITNLTADKNTLNTQKAALCAQIKTTRLVQPLCQP